MLKYTTGNRKFKQTGKLEKEIKITREMTNHNGKTRLDTAKKIENGNQI